MTIAAPSWVRDAVFYQIFPDRFAASPSVPKPGPLEAWDAPPTALGFKGGDLLGIVEHLDDLVDLGVTALYLNPVFQSAANHRYHAYDYLAVDPLLGGDDALRALLDAAHARDLRVILDGVFNHVGRGFWAFHHVLEAGAASPYRGWFHLDDAALDAGRMLRAYDPAAEHGSALAIQRLGYEAWWGIPALPKLNTDNPAVREHLLGVAEHWTRFGIDGWRLDVPMEISDPEFWPAFRDRVRAINPEAYIVAEVWHPSPDTVGDRWDAVMHYPLGEATLSFAGGASLDSRVVAQQREYAAAVRPIDGATYLDRIAGLVATYGPDRSLDQLTLLGSHDTPRIASLMGGDMTAVRLAVLLLMALPGAPSIYYGDEVGLRGEMDPGCRASMPWGRPGDRDDGLRAFVRSAIGIRRRTEALRRGGFRGLVADGSAMAFERALAGTGTRAIATVNAGSERATLSFELDGPAPGTHDPAIWAEESPAAPLRLDGGRATVELAPRSGGIYLLDAASSSTPAAGR